MERAREVDAAGICRNMFCTGWRPNHPGRPLSPIIADQAATQPPTANRKNLKTVRRCYA